jgi:hypothetical protein
MNEIILIISKMAKHFLNFIYLLVVFISCSTDNRLLKKRNYDEVVNKVTFQLSCDADNRKASQMLEKTYSQAMVYYENEIDQILTSNDPFRWTKTLEIMQKTNYLSDEILYNSAALQLICEPKVYTEEIIEVKQRAFQELYDAGVRSLQTGTKREAKEAYFYFVKAGNLDPKYKDLSKNIKESKVQATL